jgi:hypothetical protein
MQGNHPNLGNLSSASKMKRQMTSQTAKATKASPQSSNSNSRGVQEHKLEAAVAAAAPRPRYVYQLDGHATPSVSIQPSQKESAISLNLSVTDQEFQEIAGEYITWKQSLSTNFGGVRRQRLRKASGVALTQRTTRFLIGLAYELGLQTEDPKYQFSLDVLVHEVYCRALIDVLQKRSKAQR